MLDAPSPATMRIITQDSFGPADVLHVAEAERPNPGLGQVLVRVVAAGVNPVDVAIRAGRVQLYGPPPFTLGAEFSGVVQDTGPGVGLFAPGDEVFGMPLFPAVTGAYAEYAASPSRQVVRKPAELDHMAAAALPLVGLTAWQGLVEHAGLHAGQRVLIHAGGGGVGHVAIQVAKACGAHVITTASAGKHELVRSLGADEVIDYRTQRFEDVARDVDVVFDLIGGDTVRRSLHTLRPGGVFLTAVDHGDREVAARVTAAGDRFVGVSCEPDRLGLNALVDLVQQGKLRVHVTTSIPLAEASRAHELIEEGSTSGKIVLVM
jgi:NADPH:quinone reductase-like Zn-dependent oxidoreductase